MSGVEDDILLEILAIQGRGLPNKDFFKKQDPFLVFEIGQFSHRTKVDKNGGMQPEWNARIRFERLKQPVTQIMKVKCFDDEWKRKEQFIGECAVDLDPIFKVGECDGWFKLYDRGAPAGEVYLELTFHNKSKLEKKYSQNISTTPIAKLENKIQASAVSSSALSQESINQNNLTSGKPQAAMHATSNTLEAKPLNEVNQTESSSGNQPDPEKRIGSNQALVNSVTMKLEDMNLNNHPKPENGAPTADYVNSSEHAKQNLVSKQNPETPVSSLGISQSKEQNIRPNLPPIPQEASLRNDSLNQSKASLVSENSYSNASATSSIMGYYQPTADSSHSKVDQQGITQPHDQTVAEHANPMFSEVKQSPPPSTQKHHQIQQQLNGSEQSNGSNLVAPHSGASLVSQITNSSEPVRPYQFNKPLQGSNMASNSSEILKPSSQQHSNINSGNQSTYPLSGSTVEGPSPDQPAQVSHSTYSNQDYVNSPQQKTEVQQSYGSNPHSQFSISSELPPRGDSYTSLVTQPTSVNSQPKPPVEKEHSPQAAPYSPQGAHSVPHSGSHDFDTIPVSEVYNNFTSPTSQGYPPSKDTQSPKPSANPHGSISASEVFGAANNQFSPANGYLPQNNSYTNSQPGTTAPVPYSSDHIYPSQTEAYPPAKASVTSKLTLTQNDQGYPPNKSSYSPQQAVSSGHAYPPKQDPYPPSKVSAVIGPLSNASTHSRPPSNTCTEGSLASQVVSSSFQAYTPSKASYASQQESKLSNHIYPPRLDSYPPPLVNSASSPSVNPHQYPPVDGNMTNASAAAAPPADYPPSNQSTYPPPKPHGNNDSLASAASKSEYPPSNYSNISKPNEYPPSIASNNSGYPPANSGPYPPTHTSGSYEPTSHSKPYPPVKSNEPPYGSMSNSKPYPPAKGENQVYPPLKTSSYEAYPPANNQKPYPPTKENVQGYPPQKTHSFDAYPPTTSNQGYPPANVYSPPPAAPYPPPQVKPVSQHQHSFPAPIQAAPMVIEGGFVQPYVQPQHHGYPSHHQSSVYSPHNFSSQHQDPYSPSTAFPTPQPWANPSQVSFAGVYNQVELPPPIPNKPNNMPTHYHENVPPPLPSRPSYNSPYPNPTQLSTTQYQPNFNDFGYPPSHQNDTHNYNQNSSNSYNNNNGNNNINQSGPPVVPLQQGSLGKKKKNKLGFLNF